MATAEEVREFLSQDTEEAKVIKAELSKPNAESVISFIETEEGRKAVQPVIDRSVTKGIESWKTNHGAKTHSEVEEMLKKQADELRTQLAPQETPEQKRLREAEERIASMEKKEQQALIKADIVSELANQKLPQKFAQYLSPSTKEEVASAVQNLKELFDESVNVIVEERLKTSTSKPPTSTQPTKSEGDLEALQKELAMLEKTAGNSPDKLGRISFLRRSIHELAKAQKKE